jgi:hypothetical protein
MKITVESTDKIVDLLNESSVIACRVWEGQTESGVKVHCFIPRIAAKADQDLSQFERELQEMRPASVEIAAIPLRLIL